MKKLIWLFIIIFLCTGCTIVRIDTTSINNILNVILSKDNTLYNKSGMGYKYYKPRGVTYIDTDEYNETLYSNGNYYYLYVDIISYYYKKEFSYEKKNSSDNNIIYDEELSYNGKKGYLLVTKQLDDKYLVEFLYNYAKIEVMAEKEELNEIILNATYILSTIKYNDEVIKINIQNDLLSQKEEQYTFFSPKQEKTTFLEYVDGEE